MPSPDDDGYDIFQVGGLLRTDLFEPATVRALEESLRCAGSTLWDCVRTPHLFMGLLAVPDARVTAWAGRLGEEPRRLRDRFAELFLHNDRASGAVLRF